LMGIKQEGHEIDHLPPYSAEVKKDGAIPSPPSCHGAKLVKCTFLTYHMTSHLEFINYILFRSCIHRSCIEANARSSTTQISWWHTADSAIILRSEAAWPPRSWSNKVRAQERLPPIHLPPQSSYPPSHLHSILFKSLSSHFLQTLQVSQQCFVFSSSSSGTIK
jgi:hypothetical protein